MRFLSKRPKVKEPTESPETGVIRQVGPWPSGGQLTSRLFLGAVLLGVVAGPAAFVLAMNQETRQTPAAVDPAGLVGERDARTASAAAEVLVQRFLSASAADAEELAAMVTEKPQNLVLPDTAPTPPRWIGAIKAQQLAPPARWQVTVLSNSASPAAAGGIQQAWNVVVDILPTGAGQPFALPSPAPLPPSAPRESESRVKLPLTHPAAVAGAGYLEAALTGRGDITRWTAPDFTGLPVIPPACASTTPESATTTTEVSETPARGTRATLLLTATCVLTQPEPSTPPSSSPAPTTDPTGKSRTIQMVVTVVGRDGRWEVGHQASATPSPSNTPSTQPTR